ncbi:MAG: S9 family peptidase [Candidatus Sabulitectum sp.]|nr:S9 family peptidase [Candidatus Sabulitectum sp.]
MNRKSDKSKHTVLKPEQTVNSLKSVGSFSISPDMKQIAFCWKTDVGSQIHIASFRDFKPIQITDDDSYKLYPCWSPDGAHIAFTQDRDGKECNDLCSFSVKSGKVERITDFGRGFFRGFSWSPDSKSLAFSSNREGRFDIYIINLDDSDLLHISSGDESDVNPIWSPDGSYILYSSFTQSAEPHSKLRVVKSDGTLVRSIGPDGECNGGAVWSPDGLRIAFSSSSVSTSKIGVASMITGSVEWQTKLKEVVYQPAWTPDGKGLTCLIDTEGNHQIGLIDIKSGEFDIVGPLDGLCSSPEYTDNGDSIVFTHEDPRNPSDLWSLNLITNELKQLTIGCPDSIDPQQLILPEVIRFSSFDGLEIPSFLFRPPGAEEDAMLPAIVWIHGGPNSQFMNRWNLTVQVLVSNGFIVIAPNFRGSIGYGKDYSKLSIGDWGGGDLKDIIAAANYLESSNIAAGNRIGLFGGSYGGYLTLMALARAPKLWAAGVDYFGFVDLVNFYNSASGWLKEWIETQIGTPEGNPEFYHERSPINHCSNIIAPLLICQGANDPRIRIDQSQQLARVLNDKDKNCVLKIFDDEGHGFQKKANQVKALRATIDFFKKHLQSDLCI